MQRQRQRRLDDDDDDDDDDDGDNDDDGDGEECKDMMIRMVKNFIHDDEFMMTTMKVTKKKSKSSRKAKTKTNKWYSPEG